MVEREGIEFLEGQRIADHWHIGDDIGGWKVVQIEGRRLVLSLDGRLATFTLFSDDNGQQTSRDAGPQADPVTNQSPSTPQASAAI